MDYAKLLLTNSQESIRTAKLMVNALSGIDPRPAELLEAKFEASFSSADFMEGFTAFCEKRPPRFP
jgi:enoyl-CoA hydratase/carnithine racemase